MLDKINWASQKKVAETFAVLESDKQNPIVTSLVQDRNTAGMFHKLSDQLVMAPYTRDCTLAADVNTILQKLFLPSNFLCYSMGQVGCTVAYDDTGAKYELDRGGKDAFIQASIAKPISEGVWFKRFGTSKNYAPRFSPLPFNVFKGEDQYISLRDGVLSVACISACIFNGANLRTVRYFVVSPSPSAPTTSSHVLMYFGGFFTDSQDPAQLQSAAQGVRAQTFSECSSSPDSCRWVFEDHASSFLQNF